MCKTRNQILELDSGMRHRLQQEETEKARVVALRKRPVRLEVMELVKMIAE